MTLSTQAKRSASGSIHQQKRYGQHRKHTKPFLKTYYPYLPLLGIAAVFVIILGAKVFGTGGAVVGGVSVSIGLASILI